MSDEKPTRAELGRGPRTRDERGLGDRPRSLRTRELAREARDEAMPLFDWLVRDELDDGRPRTRADCKDGPRPCPYVGCRYHLFLEVKEDGRIQYTFPGKELEDLAETCALDVADRMEEQPLSTVADLLNVTRESVAEVESQVLQFLNRKLGGNGLPTKRAIPAEVHAEISTHTDEAQTHETENATHTDEMTTEGRNDELAQLVAEQAFDDETDRQHLAMNHESLTRGDRQ